MAEGETLVDRFEAHRARLRAVAYRMLGSAPEAEDAVQEAWLRLSRSGGDDVEDIVNLGSWLTTVVARVCLDMLRSRRSRREEPLAGDEPDAEAEAEPGPGGQPDRELRLADSVGLALLVVLDTLAPAERIAFVLHDLFDLPFEEIAPIIERSPTATRQLASRARRRVRGASADDAADRARRRRVVDAFLAASRDGDFDALLGLLDPEVVLRADGAAVAASAAYFARGAPALRPEMRGARAVAESFRGRARGARPALVGGAPGATWAPGGVPAAAFAFTLADGKIVAIDVVMEPARLRELDVQVLDAEPRRQ
jgi:RNA polymerase sigma-70 factor (ECF subfamily)